MDAVHSARPACQPTCALTRACWLAYVAHCRLRPCDLGPAPRACSLPPLWLEPCPQDDDVAAVAREAASRHASRSEAVADAGGPGAGAGPTSATMRAMIDATARRAAAGAGGSSRPGSAQGEAPLATSRPGSAAVGEAGAGAAGAAAAGGAPPTSAAAAGALPVVTGPFVDSTAPVDTKSFRRLIEDMRRRGWQMLVSLLVFTAWLTAIELATPSTKNLAKGQRWFACIEVRDAMACKGVAGHAPCARPCCVCGCRLGLRTGPRRAPLACAHARAPLPLPATRPAPRYPPCLQGSAGGGHLRCERVLPDLPGLKQVYFLCSTPSGEPLCILSRVQTSPAAWLYSTSSGAPL